MPATVHVNPFDPEKNRIYRRYHHYEAGYTTWDFHCMPEISYAICSQTDSSSGKKVEIEVTAVKIKLTTDIYKMCSTRASKRVEPHEDGHVTLCRDVYSHATDAATKAAGDVLQKRFSGIGTDPNTALRAAVEAAADAFCMGYKKQISDVLAVMSERYDALQHAHPEQPPAEAIKQVESEMHLSGSGSHN